MQQQLKDIQSRSAITSSDQPAVFVFLFVFVFVFAFVFGNAAAKGDSGVVHHHFIRLAGCIRILICVCICICIRICIWRCSSLRRFKRVPPSPHQTSLLYAFPLNLTNKCHYQNHMIIIIFTESYWSYVLWSVVIILWYSVDHGVINWSFYDSCTAVIKPPTILLNS